VVIGTCKPLSWTKCWDQTAVNTRNLLRRACVRVFIAMQHASKSWCVFVWVCVFLSFFD